MTITAYETTYRIEVSWLDIRHFRYPDSERQLMELVAKRFEEAGAQASDLKKPGVTLTRHAMSGNWIEYELVVPSC